VGGLGWAPFLALWSVAALVALLFLAGPLAAPLLLVSIVALEVWMANVNLLIALAIAWGFRWPVLWSFVVLTKITPGIGLLWFATRREWRSLALALLATAGLVIVSFVLDPGIWARWLAAEVASTDAAGPSPVLLLARVTIAAVVVVLGARSDRPWAMGLACVIALPFLWQAALAALVLLVPLSRPGRQGCEPRRAVDWALGHAGGKPIR
jgi:hypothetical protein